MKKIPYMNYNELVGPYTVYRVADMLKIHPQEVITACQQYKILIYQNDAGQYLIDSKGIKKLHYRLYHASRGRAVV